MPSGRQSHGAMSALEIRRFGNRWQLAEPLIYRAGNDWIYVPRGFGTDLDSVPRIPGLYALASGHAVKAAVVHDWLYHRRATRRYADRIFSEAMVHEGVAAPIRWILFAGVRAFGWIAYRRMDG